jgi:hypothetical protein
LSIIPRMRKKDDADEMNIVESRTGHGLMWSASFTRRLKHCNQLPCL